MIIRKKYFLFVLICAGCILSFGVPGVARGGPYIFGTESRTFLEKGEAMDESNYAVAYYLGKVYIAQGKTDEGIQIWEKYLAQAPEDAKAKTVRERLSILKFQRAAEYAENAVRGGVPTGDIEKNTIAVLNFNVKDDPAAAVLSKGLTAMIITDLSKVPPLQVVERERMQALLQEIRLGQSGIVDERTAQKMGKFLLARGIVHGDIGQPDKDQLQILSKVTETQNAMELGTPEAHGAMKDLFKMEKDIVFGILASLGLKKKEMDEQKREEIGAFHTTDLEAFISYSKGLDMLDQRRFIEAREAFQAAVEMDPDFGMAVEALMFTPGGDAEFKEGMDVGLMELEPAEETAEGGEEHFRKNMDDVYTEPVMETIADIVQKGNSIDNEYKNGQIAVRW